MCLVDVYYQLYISYIFIRTPTATRIHLLARCGCGGARYNSRCGSVMFIIIRYLTSIVLHNPLVTRIYSTTDFY